MNDLVALAMTGDIEAFGRLIEKRQERMTRLAMAILGAPADADDALQDWLVSVWRNLPSLRDADRFEAWSDRILVNACRRILRTRGRDRLRIVPPAKPIGQMRPSTARQRNDWANTSPPTGS